MFSQRAPESRTPIRSGSPHHGAGRLALETGAPIIPGAIAGTHKLWLGPIPKPRRVQLAFLPAIQPQALSGRPDAVSELIDRQLWPAVQREYGRELARPGLVLAGLAAIGLGAGLLARRQAKANTRLLGVVEPLKLRRRGARKRLLARRFHASHGANGSWTVTRARRRAPSMSLYGQPRTRHSQLWERDVSVSAGRRLSLSSSLGLGGDVRLVRLVLGLAAG